MFTLGTTIPVIEEAQKRLGVIFPPTFREFFTISNGIEIPPDWQVYSVFDAANPRKSANHIVHENSIGRWSYMSEDLLCIAGNGTGNQLVLRKLPEGLSQQIYVWNHETNKIRPWSRDLGFLVEAAKKRVDRIQKQIKRNAK